MKEPEINNTYDHMCFAKNDVARREKDLDKAINEVERKIYLESKKGE